MYCGIKIFFIISFFFWPGVHLTSKREMEKFKTLHNFKEELQRNISLLLMDNMNSSKKISNLSITLQEIATKLCYELYRKEPGNLIFFSKLFARQWTKPTSHLRISLSEINTWGKELNVVDKRLNISMQLEDKQKT